MKKNILFALIFICSTLSYATPPPDDHKLPAELEAALLELKIPSTEIDWDAFKFEIPPTTTGTMIYIHPFRDKRFYESLEFIDPLNIKSLGNNHNILKDIWKKAYDRMLEIIQQNDFNRLMSQLEQEYETCLKEESDALYKTCETLDWENPENKTFAPFKIAFVKATCSGKIKSAISLSRLLIDTVSDKLKNHSKATLTNALNKDNKVSWSEFYNSLKNGFLKKGESIASMHTETSISEVDKIFGEIEESVITNEFISQQLTAKMNNQCQNGSNLRSFGIENSKSFFGVEVTVMEHDTPTDSEGTATKLHFPVDQEKTGKVE